MFGEKLTFYMEKYNVRNRKLSLLTDITEGFISDMKRERSFPREDKLLLITDNLPLTDAEKEDLITAWEQDTSPKSFVNKYQKLLEENKKLKKLIGGEEEAYTALEMQKINDKAIEKLEKEAEKYKVYYDLFFMLDDDERKFIIKQIINNIEMDLRNANKYEIFKNELEQLKKMLKNDIKYDF